MRPYPISDQIIRDYLDSIMIIPRHLHDVIGSTEVSYFGRTYKTPVMISTLSNIDNVYPGGNVTLAEAARRTGSLSWNGVLPLETGLKIPQAGIDAVMSSKPIADKDAIVEMIKAYEAAGAVAFVIDVDMIIDPETGNLRTHQRFGTMDKQTPEDIRRYAECSSLPVVLKGILSTEDVKVAKDCGVKGIVASHHMGIFETTVPHPMMLPALKKAAGDDMYVFADGGIKSGADAFKCMALGADGVMIARPVMAAFKNGVDAVVDYLEFVTKELRTCLSITASPDLKHIDKESLVKRDF